MNMTSTLIAAFDPRLLAASPRRSEKAPPAPHERLEDAVFRPELGLHVGMCTVGSQRLRVAIRPAPVGSTARPLLLFNGIGANLELAASFMAQLL